MFKVSHKEETYTLWMWKEQWLPVYRFTPENVEPVDLDISNWYLSTHPDSHFKNRLILSKVDENARYTLYRPCSEYPDRDGEKESITIENDIQLYEILINTFGL